MSMSPDQLLLSLDRLQSLAARGGDVQIAELRQLQHALNQNMLKSHAELRKAGVGYPLQGMPFDSSTIPGGSYAPLVPQSIQPIIDNATFTEDTLVFWKMLAKQSVTTPVLEWVRRRSYGGTATSPFIAEGGVPAITQSEFDRNVVRMKYMAVFRQVTDVLANTQLLGNIGQARALEAADGAVELLFRQEKFLFHADSAVNPLEYDGLISSIEKGAPQNVFDAQGATISGQELQEIIGQLVSAPNYASPTHVLMSPRHYAWYQNSLLPFKRGDLAVNGPLTFNTQGISVGWSRGSVPLTEVVHMAWDEHPIIRTQGDGPPAQLPIAASAVEDVAGSKFRAQDVNGVKFFYTLEAVGDQGVTRFPTSGAVTIEAGGAAELELADESYPIATTGSIRYYNIFRATVPSSESAPTDPRKYYFVGRAARNPNGDTVIRDLNAQRPNSAPMIIIQNRPDVLEWREFLSTTMRPITLSRTTLEQFLLMMFGALKVSVPTKMFLIKNVGYG